jgi:hypothetical protein
VPMSAWSLYYLTWSVQECTQSAYDSRSPPYPPIVCDLPIETRQLIVFVLSPVTSAGMLAFKLAKIPLIRSRWKELEMLQVERTRLLAELLAHGSGDGAVLPAAPAPTANGSNMGQAALAASADAPVALAGGAPNNAASAPAAQVVSAPAPAPAALDPEFTLARNASAVSQAPVSASAAGASNSVPQEPQGAFRGVCPACQRNVYTSDEGRVREGEHYYHAGCVKGPCNRCGKSVYGDEERGRDSEGGAYYHVQCPP